MFGQIHDITTYMLMSWVWLMFKGNIWSKVLHQILRAENVAQIISRKIISKMQMWFLDPLAAQKPLFWRAAV